MTAQVQYMESQGAKIDAAVASLVPDLKLVVHNIEHEKIRTTQNNYGDYMQVIMKLGKDDRNMRRLIGLALIEAGANIRGVDGAIRALGDA